MTNCHPGLDRCAICAAHILPGEPRLDVPAVAPADDHECGWGERAYCFHVDCAPEQWDDEGPHPGCREFSGEALSAYARRMRRARGCTSPDEI